MQQTMRARNAPRTSRKAGALPLQRPVVAHAAITRAGGIIRAGGIVAFPTETVYGLGANALDARAVEKIYRAKGRPQDNPCIVHVANEAMLARVVAGVSPSARKLMDRFWPGPLTILFPKRARVPAAVTAGLPSVAVRVPDHPVALALIRAAGVPIAAPSANRSGSPSPTSAAHVRADLPRVPVLDGGSCSHGLESTVIDPRRGGRILRQGAITLEAIRTVLPRATIARGTSARPASPGMKYRHYAPCQPMRVFSDVHSLRAYAARHPTAVILCDSRSAKEFARARTIPLGSSLREIARNLYHALRTRRGSELLFLAVPRKGIGRTIMERATRASLGNVVVRLKKGR